MDAVFNTIGYFYDIIQDYLIAIPAGNILMIDSVWNGSIGNFGKVTRHATESVALGDLCVNGDHL